MRWRSLSIRRIAARFLAELEKEQQAENVWVEDIRTKIDAAISASEQTPPITYGTLRERWRNIRQPDFRAASTRSNVSMSLYVINVLASRDLIEIADGEWYFSP